MASQLTRDEVAHIADLARLDLSPSEVETFARQLTDILAYAAIVQQADTTGVGLDRTPEPQRPGTPEPLNPGTSAFASATADEPAPPPSPGLRRTSRNPRTPWRPDSPTSSIARADVLNEAPDGIPESGLLRVPKVF